MTTPPTLSVVIPVYNERGTVEELLRRIALVPIPKEVVLVDDASTDGTGEHLARLVARFDAEGGGALGITGPLAPCVLRLHRQTPNRGKGAAVRAGFALTTGSIVLVQDADLEYDPARLSGARRAHPGRTRRRRLRLALPRRELHREATSGNYWANRAPDVRLEPLHGPRT